MKTYTLKIFAAFITSATVLSAAAAPAFAQEVNEPVSAEAEPEAEPAIAPDEEIHAAGQDSTSAQAAAPQDDANYASHIDQVTEADCGKRVSKYDLIPGHYYVRKETCLIDCCFSPTLPSISLYRPIKVVDVFEDYGLWNLWSYRKAHVIYADTGQKGLIDCDPYEFYELI